MILEYVKVHSQAKTPVRAHPSDAGMDVFYYAKGVATLAISPGETAILGTGIRFGVPHGYMLEVKNKSSIAAKKQLIVGACVVDPGYDGELFVNLHNVSKEPQRINRGDKIAQVVLVPVVHFRLSESADGTLYDNEPIAISDRGDGALGSTGA